ncbi:hypothetical protein Dalk_4882 [Desulfatibacillum aliphaticivorans]|uniref:DUF4276 family protein n=2 Tax=Desulfatibacillum aliphaticivorans TaxID=218208 RepID=B8FDC7_DESAL|nr:hypothetical protein Dalk_4882 [Desulfatibacillum aliphaticivorans]
MSGYSYMIAEGVLDVVFLAQILKAFGYGIVRKKSNLPEPAQNWLNQFKWPVDDNIERKAVPAPAILHCDAKLIAIRNAQGLSKVRETLEADMEAFLRLKWKPDSLAIILDADDKTPKERFAEFAPMIREAGYPEPANLEEVANADELRSGIFSFPGDGRQGTIEDVLMPLSELRFPELSKHAEQYVQSWREKEGAPEGKDFKEFRKPSGPLKARLSAAAALLKPGKPLNASIEDQKWIPDNLDECEELTALVGFLKNFLPSHTQK